MCCRASSDKSEFISVTTRLLEGVWQPGEEAQPPDHTTSLLQRKLLLSLRCCYAPGDLLGTRSSSLINLIISPYFSKLGFLGRLAISPANFPTEDHFNCSFAAKKCNLAVCRYFFVLTIFCLTWKLLPALCWVSVGSRLECEYGQTDVGVGILSGLYRKVLYRDHCILILHHV